MSATHTSTVVGLAILGLTALALPRAEAVTLLNEDLAYLRALGHQGADAPLPAGRRTETQRRIHAENVEHIAH